MNDVLPVEDAAAEALMGQIIDEFLDRQAQGERPEVEEYARRYPQLAVVLRQILPTLGLLGGSALGSIGEAPAYGEDLSPERALGDFRLVREVGRGGMGVVYEAVQISLGRRVALKVLPFAGALDTKQLQRFKNEAQAAAHLQHQNIVPVHYVGCERGVHFYAMQFIDGQTLSAVIRDLRRLAGPQPPAADVSGLASELASGRWAEARRPAPPAHATTADMPAPAPPAEATATAALSTEPSTKSAAFFRSVAHLAVQAAEALEHAHQLGVVHRDIKPANLLLETTSPLSPLGERGGGEGVRLWITDFGLARLGTDPGLTMTGDLIGTIRYMSPEQALAKRVPIDHRTDIYSLGVTLYELLTLEPAYNGKSREEVLRQIAFEEPRPPRRLNKSVPAELETIVLKAMAKNPEERYATAQELADDLKRFLEDKPIKAKRPSLRQRTVKWARRHKTVVRASVVVLALAVVALAVSTALIWQAKNELQTTLARERQNLYYRSIALADREWSANNLARMEQLLEDCPEDLRGWEWHYLKGLRRKALLPMRHETPVFGAVFSPDGKRIASASLDGLIKLWDAKTGRELHNSFRAHDKEARVVAFSPDGRFLATGGSDGTVKDTRGSDGTVKVWDMRTDQPLRVWEGHVIGTVWSLAFSPDGKWLASGSDDGPTHSGELKLWDAATGREIWSRKEQGMRVRALAFHPDGQHLAYSIPGVVIVLNVPTAQERLTLPGAKQGGRGVAFSPDGRLLASTSGDGPGSGEVTVWDWQAGQQRLTLRGHTRELFCVAFSPDGRRLVTGGVDQMIKLWDAATGQEALTLRGPEGLVRSVAFSPEDGHRLVSAGQDLAVRVWDASPWQSGDRGLEFRTRRGHRAGVLSVAFHPQGGLLASGSAEGTVKLWDTETWTEQLSLPGSTDIYRNALAFSPDGKWLATASPGKTVKVWDINLIRGGRGKRLVHNLEGHTGGILSVTFSLDSKLLASGGYDFDGTMRIWDMATGQETKQLRDNIWSITSVAFSRDGQYLVVGSMDTTVRVWDVATAQVIRLEPRHTGQVMSVAFSRDGSLLASASGDRTVRLWEKGVDAGIWKLRKLLSDPTGGVECVAFSPGKELRLAWGGMGGTVKVWDERTDQTHVLLGHTNWVESVAFSPDGNSIASGSWDGTVKIWKAPPIAEFGVERQ
jgi:WD40 repeat protein/serine/threonine protein kinase